MLSYLVYETGNRAGKTCITQSRCKNEKTRETADKTHVTTKDRPRWTSILGSIPTVLSKNPERVLQVFLRGTQREFGE